MERIYKKIWRQGIKANQINKLFVYLNNYCNLNCKYCFYNSKPTSKLSIYSFKKALNIFIKHAKQPSITILGGEPLLNMYELKKILKISSSKKIPITVFTNGTLIDKNYKKLVNKYNLNTVISIDGDKFTTDRGRKFKNSNKSVYCTVIKNLKKLDMIKSVSVNMVITPQNVNKLSKNIMHLKKIGFKSIGISFDYSAKWNNKNIVKLKKELKKMFIDYLILIKKGEPYRFLNMYEVIDRAQGKEIPPCSNLILSSEGSLYPCDKIISMEGFNKEMFKLQKDILSERKIFFNRMAKFGLKNKQGFCDIGPYLYLKYKEKLDDKKLAKRLNKIKKLKKEIETILVKYFNIFIKIPFFRDIHNI